MVLYWGPERVTVNLPARGQTDRLLYSDGTQGHHDMVS